MTNSRPTSTDPGWLVRRPRSARCREHRRWKDARACREAGARPDSSCGPRIGGRTIMAEAKGFHSGCSRQAPGPLGRRRVTPAVPSRTGGDLAGAERRAARILLVGAICEAEGNQTCRWDGQAVPLRLPDALGGRVVTLGGVICGAFAGWGRRGRRLSNSLPGWGWERRAGGGRQRPALPIAEQGQDPLARAERGTSRCGAMSQ